MPKGSGRGKHSNRKGIISDPSKRGRDKAKLNRFQKEQLVTQVIEWFSQGFNKTRIIKAVIENAPVPLNYNDALGIVQFAIVRLEEISRQDAETIIGIHNEHYDKIYDYFKRVGFQSGMLKALKGKEKVNGLLKKSKLTINHKKTTIIERKVEYDWSKLSEPEQKRLEQLLNRASNVGK